MQQFLNADVALRAVFEGRLRQTKQWLQDRLKHQGQDGLMSRIVFNLLNDLRALKRLTARSSPGEG
jgi:CHAD domain-containing protein